MSVMLVTSSYFIWLIVIYLSTFKEKKKYKLAREPTDWQPWWKIFIMLPHIEIIRTSDKSFKFACLMKSRMKIYYNQ